MIDTKLMPSTENEELKKQLLETKKSAETQLTLAKKIQEQI